MDKKRVLISSIYSANTIKSLIIKTNSTKLILVIESDLYNSPKNKDKEEKKKAIENIKSSLKDTIEIEILKTRSLYNLYEITKDIVDKIDKIDDSEIFLNISEGRKTLAFGMYFAGQLRKTKIKAVYYLIKEDNELLKMPLPNFDINNIQKRLLLKIKKKNSNILDIRKSFEKEGKSKSLFYKYLKQLEKEGYINILRDKLEITDTGKIILL